MNLKNLVAKQLHFPFSVFFHHLKWTRRINCQRSTFRLMWTRELEIPGWFFIMFSKYLQNPVQSVQSHDSLLFCSHWSCPCLDSSSLSPSPPRISSVKCQIGNFSVSKDPKSQTKDRMEMSRERERRGSWFWLDFRRAHLGPPIILTRLSRFGPREPCHYWSRVVKMSSTYLYLLGSESQSEWTRPLLFCFILQKSQLNESWANSRFRAVNSISYPSFTI